MIKHRHSRLVLAAAIATLASMSAMGAPAPAKMKPADAAKSRAAEPAKPESQVVPYKELRDHIGAELAIETTFNTIRRGVLTKYTNPSIKIQLGPEAGSIELDVPAETIRSVSIVTPVASAAPAQAAPPQGTGSAKKN